MTFKFALFISQLSISLQCENVLSRSAVGCDAEVYRWLRVGGRWEAGGVESHTRRACAWVWVGMGASGSARWAKDRRDAAAAAAAMSVCACMYVWCVWSVLCASTIRFLHVCSRVADCDRW